MTKPVLCSKPAIGSVVGRQARLPICAEHARWLERKALTFVGREIVEGTGAPRMFTVLKGSPVR